MSKRRGSQPQQLLSAEDFLTISAQFNYLLSAHEPSTEALRLKILGDVQLSGRELSAMNYGLSHLLRAYKNRNRKLGPLAVLHPMRVSYLLAEVMGRPAVLDLLTAFLHDYYEDIYTEETSAEERRELDEHFSRATQYLSEEERWSLEQRMQDLTRQHDEEYQEYLGRLLEQSAHTPELITIKLADRLDNTYDMRIVQEDYRDSFRLIFDVLFLNARQLEITKHTQPAPGQMDEAHRLYQLFKNAIFLTLVRLYGRDKESSVNQHLFNSLATVSLQEAGRILGQIFSFYVTDRAEQRALLTNTMNYCQDGGIERLTPSTRGHRLDGLFKERFDHANKTVRKQMLKEMQKDKHLMTEAAMAFLTIFESFLASPDYQLYGIKPSGLSLDSEEDQTLDLRDPAWREKMGLNFDDDEF